MKIIFSIFKRSKEDQESTPNNPSQFQIESNMPTPVKGVGYNILLELKKVLEEKGTVYPLRDEKYGTCPHCRKRVEIDKIQELDRCYYCNREIQNFQANTKFLQQLPQVTQCRYASEMASRIGAKFGLTPSDRTGLKVPPKKQVESVEDFIFGKKKSS